MNANKNCCYAGGRDQMNGMMKMINRKDHKEHKEEKKCRVIGGILESRAFGRLRSKVSVDK